MSSLFDIVINYSSKNRNDIFYSYVKKRNWSKETIDEWQLGFFQENTILSLIADIKREKFDTIDLENKFICKKIKFEYKSLFFNRIIFPIKDSNNNTIAIAGRVLDDSKPKYFNTVFPKTKILYGLDKTKQYIRQTGRAHVFEGYADVVTSFQNNIKNVAGCMGTTLTEDHFILLSRYADEIVVFFDNDKPGKDALKRFNQKEIDKKKKNTKIYRCFLEKEKDVDKYLETHSSKDFYDYVESYIGDTNKQKYLKTL